MVWYPNGDLAGKKLARSNLRGANLYGCNLQGADLTGADLRGASLQKANLRGARLVDANLERCSMRSADLSSADLTRSNLDRADLRDATLNGTTILHVRYLEYARLDLTKLSDAQLQDWGFSEKISVDTQHPMVTSVEELFSLISGTSLGMLVSKWASNGDRLTRRISVSDLGGRVLALSRVLGRQLASIAREIFYERPQTIRWYMSRTNRAIISVCFAIVALFPFFQPDQVPSNAADAASAVRVDRYHLRECQASEQEIVMGDYMMCRSFESLGRISAEVSYICDRFGPQWVFRDPDVDGVGNCEARDGHIRKVTTTECARWNGWWNNNTSPGHSYVLGPHCEFSQAILDALAEFPESYGRAESPAAYKERMDMLAYSRELNKAKYAGRRDYRDTCNGGDECGYMGYSYGSPGSASEDDSGWYWDEPYVDSCIGDCYDMDNDGRTWNDIDRDGDGRYESD